MNDSNSGKWSSMSRNNSINLRWALRRLVAVSKILRNRTRISYSVRSCGNLWNSPSNFALSSGDSSSGRRRNSHINERNSFRSAFDNFALYPRVIFFPLAVNGLVELLGDVEAVHHRLGVGQQPAAGVVERLGHVRPVGLHLPPLLRAQFFQALAGRGLVPPFGHGQDGRVRRV